MDVGQGCPGRGSRPGVSFSVKLVEKHGIPLVVSNSQDTAPHATKRLGLVFRVNGLRLRVYIGLETGSIV